MIKIKIIIYFNRNYDTIKLLFLLIRRKNMPFDPDDLKIRSIKRQSQIQQIQKYIDEQHALDNSKGKMGHREITRKAEMLSLSSITKKFFR